MSFPTNAADFANAFAANFNRRDIDAIASFYTDDAVMDLGDGQTFRGRDAIRAPLTNFLSAGLPIAVTPRSYAETGDTAVVVFDWVIAGTAPDGSAVKIGGTAVDVLRREHGGWRQLIDLPFGGSASNT